MGTGFLSEDGSKFVSVKESADDAVLGDEGDGELNVDDVDVSAIPEEHRATFQKLAADLKHKSEMLDGLKKNSDLADAIKGLKTSVDGSKGIVSSDKNIVAEKKKLLGDIKFEEKDYYAQFFAPLIEAINKLDDRIDGLGGEVVKSRNATWQDRVVRFISDEKLPKEVVAKMDELARTMGGGVYNDLTRLAKLAKMELGIADTKKVDVEEKKTVVRKKGAVEMSSTRKTSSAKKPIKSMSDAWDAAETSLQGEEG